MQCSFFFSASAPAAVDVFLLPLGRCQSCVMPSIRWSSIFYPIFLCIYPVFLWMRVVPLFWRKDLDVDYEHESIHESSFISYTAVPSSSRSSRNEKGNCACMYASFDGCRGFLRRRCVLRLNSSNLAETKFKKKKKNALKMMSRHFQLFSHEIIRRVAKAGWVKDTVAQLSTVETRCALAGGGVRYIADQSAICDDMYVLL